MYCVSVYVSLLLCVLLCNFLHGLIARSISVCPGVCVCVCACVRVAPTPTHPQRHPQNRRRHLRRCQYFTCFPNISDGASNSNSDSANSKGTSYGSSDAIPDGDSITQTSPNVPFGVVSDASSDMGSLEARRRLSLKRLKLAKGSPDSRSVYVQGGVGNSIKTWPVLQ